MEKNRIHTILSFIFIGVLFAIGLYMRLYHITEWMPWDGDVGRDMLVARHIVEYKESPFLSPQSGAKFVINSPLYYWILSAIWTIVPTPQKIVYVFAIWCSLCIPLAYLTGMYLKNKTCGYLFASLMTFSGIFINNAQSILQPNLNQTFLLIIGASFGYWYKTKKHYFLLVTIMCIFIAFHIYFSFIPIGTLLLFLIIGCILTYRKQLKTAAYLLLFIIGLNGVLFYQMTYARGADQLFLFLTYSVGNPSFFQLFSTNIHTLYTLAFQTLSPTLRMGIEILLPTSIICCFISQKRARYAPLLIISIFYCICIEVISMFPQQNIGVRLIIYVPLIYFCISYVIASFPKTFRIFFLGIYVILTYKSMTQFTLFVDSPSYEYKKALVVTTAILRDYETLEPQQIIPRLHLHFLSKDAEQFPDFTTQYYYLFELLTNKRIVLLTQDTFDNTTPVVSHPSFDYLICPIHNAEENYSCINLFTSSMQNLIDMTSRNTIVPEGPTGKEFHVYRWKHM